MAGAVTKLIKITFKENSEKNISSELDEIIILIIYLIVLKDLSVNFTINSYSLS